MDEPRQTARQEARQPEAMDWGPYLRGDLRDLRAEVRDLRAETNAQFAQVRDQFAQVRDQFAQVRDQFAQVRDQFAQVRSETNAQFAELRRAIDLHFYWSIGLTMALSGMLAGLMTALVRL